MIKFLFLIIMLVVIFLYLKYHEQHPYFYIEKISKKYNIVNLYFINLNEDDYIEKNNIVLLEEDAIELKNILEDCYIDNIRIKKGNKIF